MKPKVGLLPLYLKLYDDTMPEIRGEFDRLLEKISARLEKKKIDVTRAKVCRVRDEFKSAVTHFERESVDLIVSVHLAYSPSLESAEVLARTRLPLLIFDTTLDARFPQTVDPMRLMYNHGIHGVQDLASVLRRMGKPYEIVAGHCDDKRIYDVAAVHARGAAAARYLRTTKALRIGQTFQGMGDFAIGDVVLKEKLGIAVDQIGIAPLADYVAQASEAEITQELKADRAAYDITCPKEVHERSLRVGLGLRKYLAQNQYTAFSMNFLAFNSDKPPIDTVPFLEASKAMARGVGYAGEGDILTASLVGALQRALGDTTFTEIFCPDWKDGSLFISHMGEVNPAIAAGTPRLCEKDFPWTSAKNPAIVVCAPTPGTGILVNIAPGPSDSFSIILSKMKIERERKSTRFGDWVRGWLKPAVGLEPFLETYSRAGGTHHCALVLGTKLEALRAFAAHAGLPCTVLE